MKVDIKEDLSILTTINKNIFSKLEEKIIWCICDCVEKSIMNGDNTAEIDFGYGVLSILIDDNSIKYKFKPNKSLEGAISNTVVHERNSLTVNVEKALINKLTSVYKNFF